MAEVIPDQRKIKAFRSESEFEPGRAKKIEDLVTMLARGETIVPQSKAKAARKRSTARPARAPGS